MTSTSKIKKQNGVTYIRPSDNILDPNLSEEELDKALDSMAEEFIDAVLGSKQDWGAVKRKISELNRGDVA